MSHTTFLPAPHTYHAAFLGAGPGGSGPLICALQQGRLDSLLQTGVAVLESSDALVRGAIGSYIINSDTLSDTFLEPLKHPAASLEPLSAQSSTRALDPYRGGPAPLTLAGAFLGDLGAELRLKLNSASNSAVATQTTVTRITANADGTYSVHATTNGAAESIILRARHVVMGMGASQSRDRMLREHVLPGIAIGDYRDKLMGSHELLSAGGIERARVHLSAVERPRVVIIGGSHSAISSAWTLLSKSGITFDAGAITVAHRNALKLFYPSAEAALADGYTDFGPDDICPLTKRLYRLAGFRFDSRELVMRVWGIAGRPKETRVHFYDLAAQPDPVPFKALLDDAALVIGALGYRPNTVPVLDAHGNPVPLLGDQAGAPPLVNRQCQVLRADGTVLPNIYGIGLASGFVPDGDLGGEPSFRGQTNGLWLYQNGVGQIILDQLLGTAAMP